MADGRVALHGSHVSVQPELLAHGQQPLLRTYLGVGVVVVLRVTNGAEEHRVGFQAERFGFFRKRITGLVNSGCADQARFKL